MSSVSKLRQMTIDNRDIDKDKDKTTTQTKMQKLRKDSASHEVIPGRGMSSYEEGIAVKNLKAYYEEKNKNKNKTPPAGGFKRLFRKSTKKSKSKRSQSQKSKRSTTNKSKSKRSTTNKRGRTKKRF